MKIFTEEQRRGLAVVIPLLLIVLLLSVLVERKAEPVLLTEDELSQGGTAADSVVLRQFDPNEAEYEELRRCGVPPTAAAGIVRWRRYGKVYRMKEDVALCTGVDDSLYAVLKPYIVISEKYAIPSRPARSYSGGWEKSERQYSDGGDKQGKSYSSNQEARHIELRAFSLDTVTEPFLVEVGFSPRQAEVVLRYRDASGGIRSEEQFRRCYVVSGQMADRLVPYIVFGNEAEQVNAAGDVPGDRPFEAKRPTSDQGKDVPSLVEINTADSAQLRSVRGIGEKSVTAIMRYRELLGGFYSVEQLTELDVVTESNYERILTQIYCDSCKISKIDINFATPKELMRHPYVSSKALRRIVKQRQLKGGWSGIEEMIDNDILSEEEAERLAPYLRFVRDTCISTAQTESPQ